MVWITNMNPSGFVTMIIKTALWLLQHYCCYRLYREVIPGGQLCHGFDITQKTRHIGHMMAPCWAAVSNAVPKLSLHGFNVSCLLWHWIRSLPLNTKNWLISQPVIIMLLFYSPVLLPTSLDSYHYWLFTHRFSSPPILILIVTHFYNCSSTQRFSSPPVWILFITHCDNCCSTHRLSSPPVWILIVTHCDNCCSTHWFSSSPIWILIITHCDNCSSTSLLLTGSLPYQSGFWSLRIVIIAVLLTGSPPHQSGFWSLLIENLSSISIS